MKKALALVLVFAMLFVVAGCGNKDNGGSKSDLTAREVSDKMIEAMSKVESIQNDVTFKMDINMAISADGESLDMGMAMDMDMQTISSTNPIAAYSKAVMVMDYMGESETQTTETYLVEEDGEYVTYTLSDDYWSRSVVDAEEKDQLVNGVDYSYLKELKDEDLNLAKEIQKIDDKETYVLSFSVSGDYMAKQGMDMEELMGLGVDMSDISFPMTMYIDTESFLPVRVTIDMESMSDMIDQMMAESMGDLGVEMKMEVKCENFVSNMTYNVEVPAVPAEAKD
jgi:ABC-type glycerol-3-phosphate transport system substrate-binding protein